MRDGALRGETIAVADPGDLLTVAAAFPDVPLFYWEEPACGVAIVGLGAARELRAGGVARFAAISAAATDLLASIAATGAAFDGGRVVGGFGFADADTSADEWREFPAARLVLPRLLWARDAGGTRLTVIRERARDDEADTLLTRAAAVTPAAAIEACAGAADASTSALARVPAPGAATDWRRRVDAATALIARGDARKVVLACRRELAAARPLDPVAVLARARAARPACRSFWIRHHRASFLGSTPELLVRLRGDRVEASALAGSARRARDRVADAALGAALLACPKNAREHQLVRDAITAALAGGLRELVVPPRPELVSLPEAHHLHTPIGGRLRQPRTVLELAGALHPTPAVCGVPREAARALIERDEAERGWYAGAIGWMDARGDGELAVALRSALVEDRRVVLWAGAGIVEGSDADLELAEVEAKMTALFHHPRGEAGERAA